MKKRIIGLDYGSKTVGVAVSDPLGFTAQGLETITRKDENKLRKTYARIEALIREYEAEQIVLGYPKNMNDTEGERVEKTLAFKEALERRTGLEVILWDERMSTVASERVLMEGNVRREDRKTYIDKNMWMKSLRYLFCRGIWIIRAFRRIRQNQKIRKIYSYSWIYACMQYGESRNMATKTITLTTDDDEEIELMVIEQTMINNVNYLLVTDSEEDEVDAYILKETGAETEEAYYEFVEDSTELEVISKVFEQMLDDIDLKYE